VILGNTVTGIATVRALAECGVEVHACLFRSDDPLQYSRYAVKVPCYQFGDDTKALIDFLIGYAQKIGRRPVLIPTGDAHALMLAKNAESLRPYYRLWELPYADLGRIVNKTSLYQAAQEAGAPIIPSLSMPTLAEVLEWSSQHAGPYLLKPSYDGINTCKLRGKNLLLETRDQLVNYVSHYGTESLVIQRMIRGGDGNIFDCYGLCDREGRVVTLSSHRRLRQFPPDFGATCLGQIPAALPSTDEKFLFDATERLFKTVRFHGIFGIEWLRDQKTGAFYLIDFNARPFLTIGHLHDCGVNLPWLAYLDLTGQSLANVNPRPPVKPRRWVYFSKDIDTFREIRSHGTIGWFGWLASIARCTSFAYVSRRDPLPGLHSLLGIAARAVKFAFRKGKTNGPGASEDANSATARTLPR
jgi:predicted ATP-grasp superfamily ATP-dependent carboligase